MAELDADQARTLCDHGIERATQRLGPAVGEIVCNDQTRSFEWTVNCDFLWHVPADCRAIVDDVLTCLTQLLDLVRENRCLIAGLEPRVDLATFVADIPDCNRLTECVQSAP